VGVGTVFRTQFETTEESSFRLIALTATKSPSARRGVMCVVNPIRPSLLVRTETAPRKRGF
jgi:hypothetical protein